ncbi:MAG: hypothetical protein JXA23_00705, partial [Bacteroidales bacterium]|nr:hypothetical protein [Bacteroidales bacterium]
MNRSIVYLTIFLSFNSIEVFSQDQGGAQPLPVTTVSYAKPNLIKSGFYLKLGPVFPMGTFATNPSIIAPS